MISETWKFVFEVKVAASSDVMHLSASASLTCFLRALSMGDRCLAYVARAPPQ